MTGAAWRPEGVVWRGWSRHSDLNRGPAVYETAALPLSYVGAPPRIADAPRRQGLGRLPTSVDAGPLPIYEVRPCGRSTPRLRSSIRSRPKVIRSTVIPHHWFGSVSQTS